MTGSELVEPAFHNVPAYDYTLGPEVSDLNRMAGFAPDPEQELALDALFGFDRRGRSVAFEACVICARQNLKTGLFKQAALGYLFITQQPLVVWSAHAYDTTQEAHRDLAVLIENCDALRKRTKRVYWGNGDESIELHSGARLLFKARTKTGGRGLAAPKVILDEGFALQPAHIGTLMPLMSVQPDPQLVYGSSAGLATSAVLRRLRDRGRKGGSRSLAYIEWCATQGGCKEPNCDHDPLTAKGCVMDDRERWQAANPLLGRTRENGTGLTVDYVENERASMPPLEFGRERLGWWDEPDSLEAVFGPGKWSGCAVDEAPMPTKGVVVGLSVSVDREWGSVGVAAPWSAGRVLVGANERRRGTDWLVAHVKDLQRRNGCSVAIDERGPAAALISDLEDAGVELLKASTTDYLDACSGFYDRVQQQVVAHMNFDDLDTAVAGAAKRDVGDTGRWAWGRKASVGDVSMLEAVTLAAWAVWTQPSYDVLDSVL